MTFAGESAWEKQYSEARQVRITCVLLADDNSMVAPKGEMEECVIESDERSNG